MRIIALLCIAAFPVSGWSQVDRPYRPVLSDLFRRAQSSELIVIATVVERRSVRTQLSNEEVFRLGDIDKVFGGILYILQVESVLCAKTDFDVTAGKGRPKPDKILVFKDRARFFDGEFYELGQRYLVFLTPHPEQKDLATNYRLEVGPTYYQAFDGERGLISLTEGVPPEVAKIRQFCRAVRPADPNVKIRRLTNLLGSGEPELLERAAVQAIEFFRREQHDSSGVYRIAEIIAGIANESDYRAVGPSVVEPGELVADVPQRFLSDHAYYTLFSRDPKSLLDLGPMHDGVSSKSISSRILVFKDAELAASEVARLEENRLGDMGAIATRSDSNGFHIRTIWRSCCAVRHGARVVLLETHDQEATMKAIADQLKEAAW